MRPLVTVLIAAYNANATVLEAVESVGLGGADDYEVILVDDGSAEDLTSILRTSKVPVRLIRLRENAGLSTALNYGLSVAQGIYIARLDADDRMLPGRLAAQVAALEADPSLVFCGTQMKMFGDRSGLSRLPTSLMECHGLLLHYCCYTHPTIMIHRERAGADLYYDPRHVKDEDYDLWSRLFVSGKYGINLSIVGTEYRIHSEQVTSQVDDKWLDGDLVVRMRILSHMLRDDPRMSRTALAHFLTSRGFIQHNPWYRDALIGIIESLQPKDQFTGAWAITAKVAKDRVLQQHEARLVSDQGSGQRGQDSLIRSVLLTYGQRLRPRQALLRQA